MSTATQSLSGSPQVRRALTPMQQATVTHAAKLIAADESDGLLPGYLRLLDQLVAIIDDLSGANFDVSIVDAIELDCNYDDIEAAR